MSSDTRDPETYAVIGAAMEVHRQLGHGFLEPVYQEALALELVLRSVPFEREVDIPIAYKGERLVSRYKADSICFAKIVVELKALGALSSTEESQIINYLKATGLERRTPRKLRRPRPSVQKIRSLIPSVSICEIRG